MRMMAIVAHFLFNQTRAWKNKNKRHTILLRNKFFISLAPFLIQYNPLPHQCKGCCKKYKLEVEPIYIINDQYGIRLH